VPAFGDLTGKRLGSLLCETGQRPQGGWTEYQFPKPGEKKPSRKLSYLKAVGNTPYVVLAGIYNDKVAIEELVEEHHRMTDLSVTSGCTSR
jgi:signal transduction histidine kinase